MKTQRIRIESMGVYLPARETTTEEILAGCKVRINMPLERVTGIRSRRESGEGEYSIDLAEKAAAQALSRSRYRAEDIDLLLVCNISRLDGPNFRFNYEASTAAELSRRLGLKNAAGFNLANACAGMMTGVSVADAYIRSGAARRVLVVAGEYATHTARTAQKEMTGDNDPRLASLTTGDAGAAFILDASPNPEVGFHFLEMYTLGAYSHCCIAKPSDQPHGGAVILTDAITMANAGNPHIVAHTLASLKRTAWAPEQIHRLIPHQTSASSIREGIKAINTLLGKEVCTPRNVVDNLRERGNTGSTTHAVALHDLIERGELRGGDRVVLSISGSGLTIGTALYQFDDLPARILGEAEGEASAALENPAPEPLAPVRIAAVGTATHADPKTTADSLELGAAAIEDCLARAHLPREQIDLIVFGGQHRTGFIVEPSLASMLAGKLGINGDIAWNSRTRTLAFDVNSGATGLLGAMDTAAQFVRAGLAKNALVVTAEVDENLSQQGHGVAAAGMNQCASALLLQAASTPTLCAVRWHTRPDQVDSRQAWVKQTDGRTFLCVQESAQYEDQLLDALAEAVQITLDSERLNLREVDCIVGPQRPGNFRKRLAAKLGVELSRVVETEATGDLFTSSVPFGLRSLEKIPNARTALLLDAGSGIQAGCAVLHRSNT